MFSISKVAIIPIALLYALALFAVVATAHLTGFEHFLRTITKENGFFETISVLFLLSISLYGVICSIRNRHYFHQITLFAILSFALLAFIAGMEEISWGQQLFHFESSEFFLTQNHQKETNLHNLIDGNLFSSILYTSIYTLFIFIPLFYKLFPKLLERFMILKYFDINPHTILVALFASIFQLYFYKDIGVVVDMLSHLTALLLFAYLLWSQQKNFWLWIHYGMIVMATLLSMLCQEVYRFHNMQYEIRESFVVLTALLIFVELIKKEKHKHSLAS
jgi:hypothetical protein